jgi:hypothetical protein
MHGKCSGSEKKMLALDEVSNFAEQPIKKNVAEEQTYWTITLPKNGPLSMFSVAHNKRCCRQSVTRITSLKVKLYI